MDKYRVETEDGVFEIETDGKPYKSVLDDSPSGLGRFDQGVYETTIQPFKELFKQYQDNMTKYREGPAAAIATLWPIVTGAAKATNEHAAAFNESVKKMDFGEAMMHLPAMVPFVGPAAYDIGKTMQEDPYRGAGQTVGFTGSLLLGAKGSRITGATKEAIKRTPVGKAVSNKVAKVSDKVSQKLYQGATKPTEVYPNYTPDEIYKINKIGLELSITPKINSLHDLYALIRSFDDARAFAVKDTPAPYNVFSPKTQQKQITTGTRFYAKPAEGAKRTPLFQDPFDQGGSVLKPAPQPKMFDVESYASLSEADSLIGRKILNRQGLKTPNKPPASNEFASLHETDSVISKKIMDRAGYTDLQPGLTGPLRDTVKATENLNRAAQNSGLMNELQNMVPSYDPQGFVPLRFSDIYNVELKGAIDPQRVAKYVDTVIDRYQTVAPKADIKAIQAVRDEFLETYTKPLSAQQAQSVKSKTYNVLGDKAYLAKQPAAAVEARKALARGLMKELEMLVPEVGPINLAESQALSLMPIIEKAINRLGNQGMVQRGLHGSILSVGSGLGVWGTTGSAEAGVTLAVTAEILRNPTVRAKLAIMIHRSSKKGGGAPIKINDARRLVTSRTDAMLKAAGTLSVVQQGQ